MSLPASKHTRNADYRHAQSLGRQRKHATTSPRQQAAAIAAIVRKRLSDGQTAPDLDKYHLNDAIWAELLDVLSADELTAIADACGGDDIGDGEDDEPSADDITRAFEDNVPFTPEPQQTPHVPPGWRDHEAPVVHSVTWTDSSGLNHMHCVRGDTLDEVLVHIRKLRVVIDTAKTRDSQTQAVNTKEPGSVSPRRCAIHDAEMTRRVSKKTGKTYSAHDTADGLCFGRKA